MSALTPDASASLSAFVTGAKSPQNTAANKGDITLIPDKNTWLVLITDVYKTKGLGTIVAFSGGTSAILVPYTPDDG